ncbi:hypothetical protein P615_22600 [Brevibacillus laterosporus PE36]|nr:hypothetical protein P615_22600 [Brevibacillus laterosporus PE36]
MGKIIIWDMFFDLMVIKQLRYNKTKIADLQISLPIKIGKGLFGLAIYNIPWHYLQHDE